MNPGVNEKWRVTAAGPAFCLDLPATVELAPSWQIHRVRCACPENPRDPDQVEDWGQAVRADFEHAVLRFAKHPEIERARLQLVELPVPRDGDAIRPSEFASSEVGAEAPRKPVRTGSYD